MAKPKAQTSTRSRPKPATKPPTRTAPRKAAGKVAAKPAASAKPKPRPKPKAAVKPEVEARPKPAFKARVAKAVAKAKPPAAQAKPAAAASLPVARRLRAKVAAEAPSSAGEWPDVGEQERVGALKFGARPAGRGFDEQRYLFPRNYEVNRVRLVVRDPEWLFAYWDVNPRAFDGIRREMGERAMALSRLTLKVADAEGSHAQIILLPYGARSWYVRIDPARRRYFAELGITLPSGQFRSLAQSNVVALPRSGPSSQGAQRSVGYREAWSASGDLDTGVGESEGTAASEWIEPGTSLGGASDRMSAGMAGRRGESGQAEPKGGASDLYRR